MTGELEKNLKIVEAKISTEASKKSMPPPLLLAVSKKQKVEKIRDLHALGVETFGENYLQEALEKMATLKDLSIQWHFIGKLQSKKIPEIVGKFQLIHTVARLKELRIISKVATQKKVKQEFLIQINIAKEESKQGIYPQELAQFIEQTNPLPSIELRGLMFFPPVEKSEEQSQIWFHKAAEIFSKQKLLLGERFSILSMGTSGDFHLATREGSTLIRVGESLFGPRD